MPMEQTKIRPTDLHVAGDPNTGEVWLHYRTGDNTAISIQLEPSLLAQTVLNLVLCAANSNKQETKEVVQLFAIREAHVGVVPGPLLVLNQEIECGISMTTTLDINDAKRLSDELKSSIEYMSSSSSPSPPH